MNKYLVLLLNYRLRILIKTQFQEKIFYGGKESSENCDKKMELQILKR